MSSFHSVSLAFQFSPKPSPTPPSNAHPGPARPSVLMWLLAFVAPLALIALPWYGRNWRKTLDHAFRSGFSPMADQYGMGDPYSFAIVWRYLAHWVNDGISGACFLLLMALAGTALWCKIRMRPQALPSEGRTLVLLWFLPFLMFLFGRNKDIRFTAPLLPAVAIVLAWMADSFLSSLKRWGTTRLQFPLRVSVAGLSTHVLWPSGQHPSGVGRACPPGATLEPRATAGSSGLAAPGDSGSLATATHCFPGKRD